ncbi:MAG: orotidine 5'-phosphate decarboxylase, partial [Candidatus Bathyarchaeia archaeon]
IPCIVIRKESKSYGLTGRIVGGEVRRGERFLFFDDVITDGRSKIEGIKPIEEMGGIVDTIIVLVDREQGGRENLESMGYRVKAIATISEIINSLLSAGKISEEEARKILDYVRGGSGNL